MITPAASNLHAHPAGDSAAPPAYPDSVHVLHGCFISTVAYLARFQAEFSDERAASIVVELREFLGLHTVAVISWRGAWWGRDEFFGIFPLNVKVAREPDAAHLERAIAFALDRHAKNEVRRGRAGYAPRPPATLPIAERARIVSQAAALLPCPSEVFWLGGDREEIPVLFFQPAPGWVALYDPLIGTAQAQCAATNPAAIVKTVATQMGYQVRHLRRDFSRPMPLPASGHVAVRL
jgi:hypothetical protein